MIGAKDGDEVGMGDVWLTAAGVDDGFHLGSATSGGIRFPLPLWGFGWPFTIGFWG